MRDEPYPSWLKTGRYFDFDGLIILDGAASTEQARTSRRRSDHAPFDVKHLIKRR